MAHTGSKRALFIASIAAGATVGEACAAAGVSSRTGARWHQLPEVRAALRRLSDDALHQAATQAAGEAVASLRVLAELRDCPAVPPGVRVMACRAVLEHARALRADLDVAERIEALEARMGKG